MSLFITVPLARLHARADGQEGPALPRVLGRGDLLSLGIGAVIGAVTYRSLEARHASVR